jgi:hypothetical protein
VINELNGTHCQASVKFVNCYLHAVHYNERYFMAPDFGVESDEPCISTS